MAFQCSVQIFVQQMWEFRENGSQQLNRESIIMDNGATLVQSFSVASYVFQMICHSFFQKGYASRKSVCWLWTRSQCCQTVVLSRHRQPGKYSVKKSNISYKCRTQLMCKSTYKLERHFFRHGRRTVPKFGTHVPIDTLTLKKKLGVQGVI